MNTGHFFEAGSYLYVSTDEREHVTFSRGVVFKATRALKTQGHGSGGGKKLPWAPPEGMPSGVERREPAAPPELPGGVERPEGQDVLHKALVMRITRIRPGEPCIRLVT
jgi:hypothetical protein